jgi:transketolase
LKKARAVRRRIIVLNAESPAGGHTGADLSQVELLTALYFRILNCSPELKESDERDIYIQSKGHAVGGYYCILAEAGFIPVDWLATYQHPDSHLPGHPVKHKTPGIELNTGALGHGLPVAVGIALAAKRSNSKRRVFVVTGDGELAEGSNWEAALVAAHYQLDNLIIINDKNSLQLAGPTKEIMNTDPLDENGAPLACRLPSVTVTIWPTWWRRWKDCSLRETARRDCLHHQRRWHLLYSGTPGMAPPGAER